VQTLIMIINCIFNCTSIVPQGQALLEIKAYNGAVISSLDLQIVTAVDWALRSGRESTYIWGRRARI
jgi:hypothetical protein